jgi:hypothetical protein
MGMPEKRSLVVSVKVVSEYVTFMYTTLGYHWHSVHVLGPFLKHPVPVDGSSPPRQIVDDIHNYSVSKAHLKDVKVLAVRRTKTV